MTELTNNPYTTPSADLRQPSGEGLIHNFKRFTAWGVFGLWIITLGIYPIYWLYTRADISNTVHKKNINQFWLITLILSTALSLILSFFEKSDIGVFTDPAISIAYLVSYLVVLFSLANRIEDIMYSSSNSAYRLSSIMVFFFSVIYLQYRINKCIDETKSNT